MRILLALVAIAATLAQAAPLPVPAERPRVESPPAGTLKATIRMSIAKIDAPAPPIGDKSAAYGNFGPLIAQLLTPEGPVDIHYLIAGGETRADVKGRLATLPAGSVILQKVGDAMIRVLNPSNKTWYEIPASQNLGTLLATPDVTIEPVGEKATIAGQRADRFRFKQTLRVPTPEGVSLPPEFPTDIELNGDLWSTDAFAGGGYASVFRTLQAFAAIPGIEALTAGGRFTLRIALRSSIMPGYEIRSEVTAIGPAASDPSMFAVPAGYQKIVPPVGGGEGENSQLHNSATSNERPTPNVQNSQTPKTPKTPKGAWGAWAFWALGVWEFGVGSFGSWKLGVHWAL